MRCSTLLILLAACATPNQPAKPARPSRGPHADEHLDAAREHARRAEELARFPESRRSDVGRFDDPNTGLWYRAFDQGSEHQHMADVHRSAAAQLQADYDEACAGIAPDLVRVSPLTRYGQGGMETDDGVVVFLATDAAPADRLLAEVRCHRAWMMLSSAGMDDTCLLDVPNIHVQAHGDKYGSSVEIRANDRALVAELHARLSAAFSDPLRRRATP